MGCRMSGKACLAGFVTVALLGAVVSPFQAVLFVGPTIGAVVALQVAMAHEGFPRQPPARRTVLLVWLVSSLLVPYVAGVQLLGALGVVMTMVLAALALVTAVIGLRSRSRARSAPSRHAERAQVGGTPPGAETEAVELVHFLSDARLLQEWLSAGRDLHTADAGSRLAAIELRAALLDEMSRRNPTGVQQWLVEGDDNILERRFREGGGSAT